MDDDQVVRQCTAQSEKAFARCSDDELWESIAYAVKTRIRHPTSFATLEDTDKNAAMNLLGSRGVPWEQISAFINKIRIGEKGE